jgi:hypothetical protein
MNRRRLESVVSGVALGLLATVYLIHFAVVCVHAVDIPQVDDWTYLIERDRLESPTWRWLLRPHNEHWIVPSKILASGMYHLTGWDLISVQVANFLIFGLLLLTVLWSARRLDPEAPWWLLAATVVFLLSALDHQNHLWAFQSVFYFAMIGFLAAAAALFSETQRPLTIVLGMVSIWFSCLSAAPGLIACSALVACFLVFKGLRARAAPSWPEKRLEILQGLAVAAALAPGLRLLLLYDRGDLPGSTPPWTGEFWRYYVNEAALTFGYDEQPPAAWGAVCLLLILIPLAVCLLRAGKKPSASSWSLIATCAGPLSVLLVIAFSRASLRDGLSPKIPSRYFIIAGLLLPFLFIAWRACARSFPRWVGWSVVAVLWLVCVLGYSDDWSTLPYQRTSHQLRLLEDAVRDYYQGVSEHAPRILDRRTLDNELDVARDLRVSFARRLARGTPARLQPRNDPPIGSVRALRADGTLEGWALDPDTPSWPVRVSLLTRRPGGRLRTLATAVADMPRPDVNTTTGLPGDHGFRLSVPAGFSGDPATLLVFASESSVGAGRVWLPSGGLLREPKTSGLPIGFVDAVSESDGVVSGWAFDPDQPAAAVRVGLFELEATDGELRFLGWTEAGMPRPDVENAFGFPGDHGFRFSMPDEIRDGRPHTLFFEAADEGGQRRSPLNRRGIVLSLTCRRPGP